MWKEEPIARSRALLDHRSSEENKKYFSEKTTHNARHNIHICYLNTHNIIAVTNTVFSFNKVYYNIISTMSIFSHVPDGLVGGLLIGKLRSIDYCIWFAYSFFSSL